MISKTVKFTIWPISTGTLMPRSVMPRNTMRCRLGFFRWFLEHEANHDGHDQRVNRDGLGEGDTKNHVGLDDGLCFRVAAQGFHRLADEVTDSQARPKASDTNGKSGTDVLECDVADLH